MGRWLITSAWPYVNRIPHLGNLIGSLLSADVFARYLRLKGEEVLYVTGSDQHGTPIEVEAIKSGVSPESIAMENHKKLVKILRDFKISTDNYTYTHNPIHQSFVQEFYMKIYRNKYVFMKEEEALYCERDKMFLPDRFVTGVCPYCGYEHARGDQCENCKSLLTPIELINPKCVICGGKPIIKRTNHWYFDLPRFAEELRKMIKESTALTENAKNFSLQMIDSGLKPRSVTRDNKWGIPSPFPESQGKTIYVWMEAVLGYVSAVIEYFKRLGKPEKWRDYWFNKETRIVFFIGKDNIPFHTVIFPALLMATGEDYNLNFFIAATEFLLFEGDKFSKSRGIGIWLDEALKLLPSEYWRYVLILIRPEVKDTNFTWDVLEKAVNNDLNNQLGNLFQRIIALINRFFNGYIPKPENLEEVELSLINEVAQTKRRVEEYMESFRIQRALISIMDLVRKCNSLLNMKEPWRLVKSDRKSAGNTVYAVSFAIKGIGIMISPFLPETGENIIKGLGLNPKEVNWNDIEEDFPENLKVASEVTPLFRKVKVDELKRRLHQIRGNV